MPGEEAGPRGPRSLESCQGRMRPGFVPGEDEGLDLCPVRSRAWNRSREVGRP